MGWPARPLHKVEAALKNSYMVSSLVLRVMLPPQGADPADPGVVVSEQLIGGSVQGQTANPWTEQGGTAHQWQIAVHRPSRKLVPVCARFFPLQLAYSRGS